jgi:hypothetical protein
MIPIVILNPPLCLLLRGDLVGFCKCSESEVHLKTLNDGGD